MSAILWIGGATAVQQEDRFTPANVESTDDFTLTSTGEDGTTTAITFTATGSTVANVTAGLAAAWNASTHRLCTGVTASDQTSYVKLLADVAGVPFSVAGTTTDHGGANTQTLTRTATTANVGPNDVSLAANYYNNAVPSNSGDTLTIDGRTTAAILYGLNLSAKTLDQCDVYMSNAQAIGTTVAPLRISATVLNIGLPAVDGSRPSGPNLIAFNTGTVVGTVNVYDSNRNGTNGLPTVNWKGTHASNVVNVLGGVFGAGTLLNGDVATIATFNQEDGIATLASGVTLTTARINGGSCLIQCAATTINQDGGTLKTTGSGAITTLYCSGPADLQSTGTITTLEIRKGGKASFAGSTAARTVTTIKMYPGASLDLDNGVMGSITITNPIQLIGCALPDDVKIITPKHVTVTLAAGA